MEGTKLSSDEYEVWDYHGCENLFKNLRNFGVFLIVN